MMLITCVWLTNRNRNGALIYSIAYESSGLSADFDSVYHRTVLFAVCYANTANPERSQGYICIRVLVDERYILEDS